jgi:hypothetical protein
MPGDIAQSKVCWALSRSAYLHGVNAAIWAEVLFPRPVCNATCQDIGLIEVETCTMSSAILREIKTKGKEARFKRSDRGQFAANGFLARFWPEKGALPDSV